MGLFKLLNWKFDLVAALVVALGFYVIDEAIGASESLLPHYYQFLMAAKWLLIGGFALHGTIDWLLSRRR